MSEYRDKLLSVGMWARSRKDVPPKVTTDVHDHHTVDVTEHWSDRQDVTVHAPCVSVKGAVNRDG